MCENPPRSRTNFCGFLLPTNKKLEKTPDFTLGILIFRDIENRYFKTRDFDTIPVIYIYKTARSGTALVGVKRVNLAHLPRTDLANPTHLFGQRKLNAICN